MNIIFASYRSATTSGTFSDEFLRSSKTSLSIEEKRYPEGFWIRQRECKRKVVPNIVPLHVTQLCLLLRLPLQKPTGSFPYGFSNIGKSRAG